MHLRQFVRCWLTLSDFHCVSVSGPSRSFVDNGMSFIFWKVWPTAFRFRLQRLFLHNLFFEVCPAFASLSFVWVVLFRMPKDFTLSNWVLGLKISQLWFHHDQCKRTCICKTRRFFNKANSLTDPSNENIYTKNCHLNKCHKNVFLWLFLTYTVQTPLALRPFINHIMQILDLSHFNDPFVGFNSLAWGHFQCDVCVVFVFFWLFSFRWRMILSQCFCLSWHFMWAITALRLKHFSFLLLLLWSQHRRSFSQNFPWSCHRKIRKRWKGKALTQAAWLKIWNRVRDWFGRSETWIKLWPRQRRGSYLGTLWSSQNSLVILFLHSLIFDPSGMENS